MLVGRFLFTARWCNTTDGELLGQLLVSIMFLALRLELQMLKQGWYQCESNEPFPASILEVKQQIATKGPQAPGREC